MRISDWSSDVCSSDLERDARTKYYRLAPAWQAVEVLRTDAASRFIERAQPHMARFAQQSEAAMGLWKIVSRDRIQRTARAESDAATRLRSEEHTSELQSLMRISYAVLCLKTKTII